MKISTQMITSKSECDLLITMVNKEKRVLEHRKEGMVMQHEDAAVRTVEIEAELQSIAIQLTALDGFITSLPEGDIKKDNLLKQENFRHRQFTLRDRQSDLNVITLVEKEFDIIKLESQIEDADTFIREITDRKNAL